MWSVVAALGGVACLALPPLLFPDAEPKPPYGHPLLPWLATAFANVRFLPTMAAFLALGVVLGMAQPTRRLLMVFVSWSLLSILHVVNIVGDIRVDPTDHNLLPFEFVMIGALVLPALPGVFIGALFRRRSSPGPT